MRLDIAELVGQFACARLMGDAERYAVMGPVADQLAVFVVEPGAQMVGIVPRFLLGVAHDHMDAQPVLERASMRLGSRMDGLHALGTLFLRLGPHPVAVARSE